MIRAIINRLFRRRPAVTVVRSKHSYGKDLVFPRRFAETMTRLMNEQRKDSQ